MNKNTQQKNVTEDHKENVAYKKKINEQKYDITECLDCDEDEELFNEIKRLIKF